MFFSGFFVDAGSGVGVVTAGILSSGVVWIYKIRNNQAWARHTATQRHIDGTRRQCCKLVCQGVWIYGWLGQGVRLIATVTTSCSGGGTGKMR
jgi:hypothetical protein